MVTTASLEEIPIKAALLEMLKELPESSGVYHYFDSQGKLLYIGKAKNLKKRVRSYFQFTPVLAPSPKLSPRIHKMISESASLHYIVVENEHDALILENSLIKQLKPRYNILLRDDKTYPYIYYNEFDPFPRLEITRRILPQKGVRYFGPYTQGARELLDSLYELTALVQKKNCLKEKKACLFYQIERCKAPCVAKISKEAYLEIFKEALELLGNQKRLVTLLEARMASLAEQLRFEEAKELRDRIQKLQQLQHFSQIDLARLEDLDLFVFTSSGNRAILLRLFMREGKITAATHNTLLLRHNEEIDLEEIYKRAILHYYDASMPLPPRQILLPYALECQEELESHLGGLFGHKVALHVPKQGSKKSLLQLAFKNAEELLKIESNRGEESLLESLQALLGLQSLPQRIEAFDTSHLRGEACVGAMVVYEGEFCKDSYRRYALEGHDEYAQMREMLSRRAASFEKESPPDLWLLDGGAGQIRIAKEILESVGANVEVVAIAKEKLDGKAYRSKGAARDLIRTEKGEIALLPSDKRLQLLQKIRDEVHRFAITYHRKTKIQRDSQIDLLTIKGIKRGKLKRLLDLFGSFEKIRDAERTELEKIITPEEADALIELLQEAKNHPKNLS